MNSRAGWVLKVGLNLHLSEALDISTETSMKGCEGGSWDLQLQRPTMPSLDMGTGLRICGVLMVQVGRQSSSHRTQHQEERGWTGWWLGPAVLLVCVRACNSTVSLPSIPHLGQGHLSFLVAQLKDTGRAQGRRPSIPCSGCSPAQQSSEFKAPDTTFPALKNSKCASKSPIQQLHCAGTCVLNLI